MFTPLDFTSISRPEISESLVGMFKGTVQRFSDRIAIEDWSGTPPTKQQYSYAELDNASDHLAKTLQANGIHRGCLVPILTTRSMPMVIAVLGVLKAGACYVPIDLSAWGADRIEVTLKTVGAAKVLCTEASSAIPPEYEVIQFLATDAVWTPAHDPSSLDSPTPDDLAYIIFTSGSTGRPKGVKVAHRSMVAYAYENGAGSPLKFVVTAESRMLVMFSIAFDGQCHQKAIFLKKKKIVTNADHRLRRSLFLMLGQWVLPCPGEP
jgi:non-ribosomal peptide synthetase component F